MDNTEKLEIAIQVLQELREKTISKESNFNNDLAILHLNKFIEQLKEEKLKYKQPIGTLYEYIERISQSSLKDKIEIATKRFTKLLEFVKSKNDINKILKVLYLLTPDYIYKYDEDHPNAINYDINEIEKLYNQLNN